MHTAPVTSNDAVQRSSRQHRAPAVAVAGWLLLLACLPSPVSAAEAAAEGFDAELCSIAPGLDQSRPEPVTDRMAGTLVVDADNLEAGEEGRSRLVGNVLVRKDEEFVSADILEFDRDTGELETLSPARFGDADLVVDAEAIRYNTRSGTGSFEGVEFIIPSRPARGAAESLQRSDESTSELEGVAFTTCPPGNEDWMLRASSMHIDQESGRGTGRNVRLAFMGIPFFYTPWIQFPVDDRRLTGLLFPEFGSSELSGDWVQLPVYINIAENYDATLAPLFTSRRGTRLDGEFRYLWNWGEGELDTEYLERDRITDETRYQGRLQHHSRFAGNWNAMLDLRSISDEEYLQDFSEDGGATAQSFIPSSIILTSAGIDYGFRAMLQRYDSVDPSLAPGIGPYEQWPAVEYSWSPLPFWGFLDVSLDASAVDFRKDAAVQGWRQHAEPAIALDLGSPGFRVTPRLALAHTRYELENPDGSRLEIDRSLPVASLDTQLVFERLLDNGGSQTLEPRLFLLSVPDEDQAAIPLFDTRRPSPTLDNLYRHNRFPGLDRYGDARQATVGLDNNWYEAGAYRPWLSFRIAQAFYFDDRDVTLPGEPVETDSTSDLFTELQYAPLDTSRLRLTTSWDDREGKVNIASLQYQYQPADAAVLNLSYSYRRDIASISNPAEPLRQASLSFAAPLGNSWRLFGKTVRSFAESQSLENLAGFEYESCCWSFRVFNRRYIFNRQGDFNQAIWLQLTLKGMGSVGRRADEFLAEDIRGYGEPL